MKTNIIIVLLLVILCMATSCKDEHAVVLGRNVQRVDTTFTYRVRTTEGMYRTITRKESFKVNDTIDYGF